MFNFWYGWGNDFRLNLCNLDITHFPRRIINFRLAEPRESIGLFLALAADLENLLYINRFTLRIAIRDNQCEFAHREFFFKIFKIERFPSFHHINIVINCSSYLSRNSVEFSLSLLETFKSYLESLNFGQNSKVIHKLKSNSSIDPSMMKFRQDKNDIRRNIF